MAAVKMKRVLRLNGTVEIILIPEIATAENRNVVMPPFNISCQLIFFRREKGYPKFFQEVLTKGEPLTKNSGWNRDKSCSEFTEDTHYYQEEAASISSFTIRTAGQSYNTYNTKKISNEISLDLTGESRC
jgi:hypothetical protein